MQIPLWIVLVVSSACSDKDHGEGSNTTATPTKDGENKASTKTPIAVAARDVELFDSSESDKLWSLAPAETVLGIVLTPKSAADFYSALIEVAKVVGAREIGAAFIEELRQEFLNETIDVFDPEMLSKTGLSLEGGLALFVTGEESLFALLPVANREAFRKLGQGSETVIDGASYDQFKNIICSQKAEHYLCAATVEDLATFGTPSDTPLHNQIKGLDVSYRGDLEVAMDFANIKTFSPQMANDLSGLSNFVDTWSLGFLRMRVSPKGLSIRLNVQATPKGIVASAPNVESRLTKETLALNPDGMYAFRFPMELILASMTGDEKLPGPAGLRLRDDLIANLTGEFIAYSIPGSTLAGRIRIGLKEATHFKTAVNIGCGMLPMTGIAGIEATPSDGSCDVELDVSKLPVSEVVSKAITGPLKLKINVDAQELWIDVEAASHTNTESDAHGTFAMLEGSNWNFLFWFDRLSLAAIHMPYAELVTILSAEEVSTIKFVHWLVSHIRSVGVAGAIRDDGFDVMYQISTYAADPPKAYQAYQADLQAMLDGEDGLTRANRSQNWPESRTTEVYEGVNSGTILMSLIVGMAASGLMPSKPEE